MLTRLAIIRACLTFEHLQQVWRILWYFATDSWVNDQPVGFEDVMGVIGTLFFQGFGRLPGHKQ